MNPLRLIPLFISAATFSQSGYTVSGNIKADNRFKSPDVRVLLFNQKNELVKTATPDGGNFYFKELQPQVYHLEIQTSTTTQKEEPFRLSENKVFNLSLADKSNDIDEVKLTSKKKTFKIEKGNVMVDVANTAFSKVPSSVDLLAKLPYISVDADHEGISVVGKGSPLLYVDNQKVDFSTVAGISVDNIKSVEIIRNPSAKYEAEGNAVVKVILKKGRKEGSSLILTETAVFNKKFSNNFSANYQKKKNKTEWKANASYNQINHWESNGYEYSVPSRNICSDYIIKSETSRPQTIFGGGVYQDLGNDGDYLSLNFNANLRPDHGDNNTVTHYTENSSAATVYTLDHQKRMRASINSTFNYNKNLKSLKGNLFAGFQFNRESDHVDYDFYNDTDNQGYVFQQFRKQKYAVNAYSGKFDFEKKIKDGYLLAVGANYIRAESLTDSVISYTANIPSDFYKNIFTEENKAVYGEFSGEIEKFSFKGGVRMEATNAKDKNLITNENSISRKYVDWFPSAELSFKENKDFVYTLNFSRTVSRPSYSDLSGGGLYSSPYVEYSGNPNLLPSYTNTLSASVNLKKWALNASYYQTKNPMGFNLVYDGIKNVSKFTTLNFNKETGLSLGLDVPFSYKKWTSQNSLSLNYSKTEDTLAIMGRPAPYLYFYTNNTLDIGRGYQLLMDSSWVTKRNVGLYENNAMLLVNLGITKSVSKFDFTLRYDDVLKQNTFKQKMIYDSIMTKGTFYGNTPVISLGLKYNLGIMTNASYKTKAVNESTGRM